MRYEVRIDRLLRASFLFHSCSVFSLYPSSFSIYLLTHPFWASNLWVIPETNLKALTGENISDLARVAKVTGSSILPNFRYIIALTLKKKKKKRKNLTMTTSVLVG